MKVFGPFREKLLYVSSTAFSSRIAFTMTGSHLWLEGIFSKRILSRISEVSFSRLFIDKDSSSH